MELRFKAGDRVFRSIGNRIVHGTILRAGVAVMHSVNPDQVAGHHGYEVETDPVDRRPSWGEEPYPSLVVWPDNGWLHREPARREGGQ